MDTRRDESYHAALASATRRHVLDTLARSPKAMDARALASALGLHVTTVRFHLQHLEEAGLVGRTRGPERRRGRPRMLYRVVGSVRDDDAREQLLRVLAAALAARGAGGEARSLWAGRRWADRLAPPDGGADPGLPALVDTLDRLGFGPQLEGETVQLRTCPFREAAREHPEVVCTVHRGLIEGILRNRTSPPPAARLLPFVEPELCVIRLDPPGADAG
ncbi:MAG: helix-turn-helix domain-containing protein [Candidatus Dormibacteraceae bacterium]